MAKNTDNLLQEDQLSLYKMLVEQADANIFIIDNDLNIQYINDFAAKILHSAPKDLIGKAYESFFAPEVAARMKSELLKVFKTKKISSVEGFFKTPHREFWLKSTLRPFKIKNGEVLSVMGVSYDITEAKIAEEMLEWSRENYQTIFENTGAAMAILEQDTTISTVNSEFVKLSGYSKEELEGKKSWTDMVDKSDLPKMLEYNKKMDRDPNSAPRSYAFKWKSKAGKTGTAWTTVANIPKTTKRIVSLLDITDRERSSSIIQEYSSKLTSVLEITAELALLKDSDSVFRGAVDDGVRKLGFERMSIWLTGHKGKQLIITGTYGTDEKGRLRDERKAEFTVKNSSIAYKIITGERPSQVTREKLTDNRGKFVGEGWQTVVPLTGSDGKAIGMLCVDSLFTDKKFDEHIVQVLRLYATSLSSILQSIDRAESIQENEERIRQIITQSPYPTGVFDEKGLLVMVNKLGCEIFGVKNESQLLFKYNLLGNKYIKNTYMEKAVKDAFSGKTVFVPEIKIASQPGADARPAAIMECTLYPIFSKNHKLTNVVVKWNDITANKRLQEEIKASLEKIKTTRDETIKIIAKIVEMRDPYTAGHQLRVANLAEAMAKDLGMKNGQVETVKLAGLLHDIGKISVPIEILTKPGKISQDEYDIIKTHPRVGYEMIKDMEFPSELREAILQHHERLSGSGYPLGLGKKDITLEAKILAVADVVEAMSSHRPYRPAIGVKSALKEISDKKHTHYDDKVVRSCLKIFKNKTFKFE